MAMWVDMNYVCAVYGVVAIVVGIDWAVRGHHHFRGQATRHEQTAVLTAGHVVR